MPSQYTVSVYALLIRCLLATSSLAAQCRKNVSLRLGRRFRRYRHGKCETAECATQERRSTAAFPCSSIDTTRAARSSLASTTAHGGAVCTAPATSRSAGHRFGRAWHVALSWPNTRLIESFRQEDGGNTKLVLALQPLPKILRFRSGFLITTPETHHHYQVLDCPHRCHHPNWIQQSRSSTSSSLQPQLNLVARRNWPTLLRHRLKTSPLVNNSRPIQVPRR